MRGLRCEDGLRGEGLVFLVEEVEGVGCGGQGGEVVGVRLSCVCCRMSCDTCASGRQPNI